jgi:DNA-binding MarR family transcriptional regulator
MDRLKNFGFLIKDVSRRYALRFEQRAAATTLTMAHCKALAHLERHEGVSQARLAELIDVDPMTMVRLLDRMEADQLIERRADPSDRRARRLYLLEKARPVLAEIWHLAELTRAEVFAGVGDADRETFMQVLEQMHATVSALEGGPVQAAAQSGARAPQKAA